MKPVKDAAFVAVATTPYLSLGIYRPRHVAFGSLVSCRRVRQQDFTAILWEQNRNVSICFVQLQSVWVLIWNAAADRTGLTCVQHLRLKNLQFVCSNSPPSWHPVVLVVPNSHIHSGNIWFLWIDLTVRRQFRTTTSIFNIILHYKRCIIFWYFFFTQFSPFINISWQNSFFKSSLEYQNLAGSWNPTIS